MTDYAPKKFLDTIVELDGKSQSVEAWCKERGLRRKLVYERRTIRSQTWEQALSPKKKQWSKPSNANAKLWGSGFFCENK